ncbi:MAG: OsmC family protein [Spirochaetes bacterium]|nr:OsmC family protein [Spirochaetota bacterium]
MSKHHAKAVHIKGITFNGLTDSNHWVPIDGPAEFGGSDAAIRPKELILLALAGCAGIDVASIMTKMRVPYSSFEVHIDAEMTEIHPKVYSKIHITFKVWGENIDEAKIKKAMYLSAEEFCGVSAMLKNSIEITDSCEINPEE